MPENEFHYDEEAERATLGAGAKKIVSITREEHSTEETVSLAQECILKAGVDGISEKVSPAQQADDTYVHLTNLSKGKLIEIST